MIPFDFAPGVNFRACTISVFLASYEKSDWSAVLYQTKHIRRLRVEDLEV